MPQVYVSIGSNIAPESNIRRALQIMRERFGDLACSPVYRCPATGFEGEDFLNLAVGFASNAPAGDLARQLREIEDYCGRDRSGPKFSARTLDLDLLTYGEQPLEQNGLSLPRSEILEYAFVLKPLADLAPNEQHPQLGKTYAQLWAEFGGDKQSLQAVPFVDSENQ